MGSLPHENRKLVHKRPKKTDEHKQPKNSLVNAVLRVPDFTMVTKILKNLGI